jgi:hypothetical protein
LAEKIQRAVKLGRAVAAAHGFWNPRRWCGPLDGAVGKHISPDEIVPLTAEVNERLNQAGEKIERAVTLVML